MNEELAVVEPQSLAVWTPRFALTVNEAVELVDQKREFMKRVMRENEHYGVIPGAKKPSLWKPGAELLLSSMGLHPRYRDTAPAIEDWTGAEHNGEPFFRYRRTCMITRSTGPGPDDYVVIAEASGNCNSWEKKYRYRAGERMCPTCGKTGTVIKGKDEYGGGWLCFKKRSGCGAKFAYNDKRIMDQAVGDVPNPDIADLVNTLEKMADKRALVAATLLATGCSDIFTQDLEDGGAADDDRAPAVDEDGVIANPSAESLKAVSGEGMPPAPSSSGPPMVEAAPQPSAGAPTPTRSGPRAKRGNVVQAPQGAQVRDADPASGVAASPASPETPATAPTGRGGFSYRDHGKEALLSNAQPPNEPVGPTPLADEIAKMQAKVEELKAKARARDHVAEDGEAEYLATLRQSTRESAALLRQLRVRMINAAQGASVPVPEATPSSDSDESLAVFIANQHPGKTLMDLNLPQLEAVSRTLDDLIVRVEAKLK